MALTTVASLDAALEILARKKFAWATAPLETKIAYLLQARKGVAEVSRDWVDVAAAAKGISGPQVGEEWLGGVYPV
ncbi:MAG TPA: aldehyde dehydrogenase, partial [Acidimicrobiia bacterium]|nr:aldehyde dehydrogenase [Acidimicrobiia bacterium]